MSVYAISDLHLSFSADKKMDVFGGVWVNYTQKIAEYWNESVLPHDSVILAGDTSWATYIEDAVADFSFLESLPGTKYLLKGNHDYWWTTRKKMDSFIETNGFKTIRLFHNEGLLIGDTAFCGTRGWKQPDEAGFGEYDLKLREREFARLKISLGKALEFAHGSKVTAVFHYPPYDTECGPTEFTGLLRQHGVSRCIYGHIHGERLRKSGNMLIDGIECINVSADCIDFKPYRLTD